MAGIKLGSGEFRAGEAVSRRSRWFQKVRKRRMKRGEANWRERSKTLCPKTWETPRF